MSKKGKVIVLFDIDHTLFDAALYREKIFELLVKRLSYPNKEILIEKMESIYYELRKEMNFEPTIFINRVITYFNLSDNAILLERSILAEELLRSFLFEETTEVIKILAKTNVELGIFSGGRRDLQVGKISEIKHFFHGEHIHIIRNHKDEELDKILHQYKDDTLYIVDDILTVLQKAKKIDNSITTIWSKRGRFAKNQKTIPGFSADYEIMNLREIIPIIKNKL